MALQTAYKQFLAAPNSDALAANASLNYITTTTSYNGPTEIIRHIGTQQKQVKKNKEEFLSVVEGKDSIAVEVETSLEFVTSGGAYLPGLDDNFLADRKVYLAVVHIVAFDNNGKILRIRQSWDQGSLLEQIEVIGKTGRNWPIRDSTEQIKLIASSAQGAAGASAPAQDALQRSRGNSTNVLRDPHASLSLFGSREEIEGAAPASVISPYAGTRQPRQRDFSEMISEAGDDTPRAVVSPYAGTKPNQRSFHEIFGDEAGEPPSPSSGRERTDSPSKAIAPKIGAGKNFQPSRLFDRDGPEVDNDTPEKPADRFYRPHATKYNHFDFSDGSDPQDAPKPGFTVDKAPKSKHDSTWSFEDFATPNKPRSTKIPAQAVRHWGNEEDDIPESPGKHPMQPKPRRDAETHFEFRDDGPAGEPRPAGRPRGATHNEGLGLYEQKFNREDGSATEGQDPRALGNITNVKDRRKDFDAHFTMTDDSPHHATSSKPVMEDRKKAVKMMEANWASYDESPSQKENKPDSRGINTAGDGMGGKKGSGRGWSLGDEETEGQRGIVTAGDGMGRRKGQGQAFSINDTGDEDKDAEPRKVKIGAGHRVTKDFWDF